MADAIPLYDSGNYLPCKAADGVLGKRFVDVSAARDANGNIVVAHAGAGTRPLGVCQFDARASEDFYVTVAAGAKLIIPVIASGAITAGDEVEVAAGGLAATLAAGTAVGKAVDDAADGADCFVQLY